MPIITQISDQKRRPNRRNVYLDGSFSFGCNVNVIARFRLREGMALDAQSLEEIQLGEVKQGCIDAALRLITARLHSESELRRKLTRQEWGVAVIDATIDDLTRLNYLDDARFARTRAESAATHRRQGSSRAKLELMKAGVSSAVANKAVATVYESIDTPTMVRSIVERKLPSLKRLPIETARRRLTAFLQRRGFGYDVIRPLIDEFLRGGDSSDWGNS